MLERPIDRAFVEQLIDDFLATTDSSRSSNSSTNDDGYSLRDLLWI